MDTTKTITHVSLCAGYGGIDLGLKRAIPSLRTIAFSEIEAFACANLVSKMEAGLLDQAPIWTNLKTFPWGGFHGRVDVLSGGYPCQPFSAAGKRLGTEDHRHLWPFIADGIRAMRPRLCFFENVEGHVSLGLREVIAELESLCYATTWGVFSAAEVGAPHQRKRVFILAHNQRERVKELARQITTATEYPPLGTAVLLAKSSGERSATGIPRSESGYEGHAGIANHGGHQDCHAGALEDARDGGWCRRSSGHAQEVKGRPADTESAESWQLQNGFEGPNSGAVWPSRPGEPQHEWEPPRVVGNAPLGQDDGREPGYMGTAPSQGRRGDDAADGASEGVADASILNGHGRESRSGWREWGAVNAATGNEGVIGQAQPPLGGDTDGPAYRLDYAELCVTSDNRTDELRLLGNGVVPATAHKAFVTLLDELNHA